MLGTDKKEVEIMTETGSEFGKGTAYVLGHAKKGDVK